MRVFPTFQEELLKIDSRITVVKNNNYPQLANILLDGINVCAIPSGEIKEEVDPSYTIVFPNGFVSKHRSRPEALSVLNNILESLKTDEGREVFYAKE
jgi:hypothetical protein